MTTTDTAQDTQHDAVEAPEPTQDAPETPEGTQEPQESPQEPDTEPDDGKGGREAAKYRRRLRETEAERDQLASQLEAMRRQVVENATRLYKPAGLWMTGVKPGDLFAEDGTLDQAKVDAAVQQAKDQFGLASRPRPLHVPREGDNPRPPSSSSSWEAAFRP